MPAITTLEGLIDTIQTAVDGIAGVNAPANPPEMPSEFPFAVTYTTGGTLRWNTEGDYRGLHNIIVELHIGRVDLPNDIATLLPYFETVSRVLFDVLGDNVLAQETNDIPYTFGELGWGATDNGQPLVRTIGFTWTLRGVKILTTLS